MTTRAGLFEFLLAGVEYATTGMPVASGTAYFYEAGTTTQKYVWTEIEKTNGYYSVTLDAVGSVQIYGEGNYKVVIKTSGGATVATFDNVRVEFPYYGIRTVTAGTVTMVSQDDFIRCNTSAGTVTINCLAAASWTRPLKVKRIAGSNSIIINPDGSETIDGAATLTITSNATVEIISDGSNLESVGFASTVLDGDGDTGMVLDENADEDIIRFDAGGTQNVVQIYSSGSYTVYVSGGLSVLSGNMYMSAGNLVAHEGYVQIDQDQVFIGGGLTDTDGDTKVQVEEAADEDKIRIDTGGTERALFSGTAAETYAQFNAHQDVDGDTQVMVESAADEDIIRLHVGGTQNVMRLYQSGSYMVYASGGMVVQTGGVNAFAVAGSDGRSSFGIRPQITGVYDGTYNIDIPTNGIAAAKFMTGDSNTIAWFYLNTAPPGWKVLSTGADTVLAVSGGASQYNVNGGNPDTVNDWTTYWNHTLLTAEIPAHAHQKCTHVAAAGGSTDTNIWAGITGTTSSLPTNTGSAGGGGSHNHGRPSASVGKLFQLDTA